MFTDPIFYGRVDLQGRLLFSKRTKALYEGRIVSMVGKDVGVRVDEDKALLSNRQRRWYFGQVLGQIHRETGQPVDDLHLFFKRKYLGDAESRLIVIVDGKGNLIEEANCTSTPSITVCSTTKMTHYLEDIRRFAAADLHIDIPDPDPQFRSL
jgi:hypothetical protein